MSGFPLARSPSSTFQTDRRSTEACDFHETINPRSIHLLLRRLWSDSDTHTHTHTLAITDAYLQSNSWRTKKDLFWIYSPPILDKSPTFSFASQHDQLNKKVSSSRAILRFLLSKWFTSKSKTKTQKIRPESLC